MNKKFLLAAGLMVFVCACQPKVEKKDDQKKEQGSGNGGGCCGTKKESAPSAPVVEMKAPAVAPQQAPASQPTASTPEVKVEVKTP